MKKYLNKELKDEIELSARAILSFINDETLFKSYTHDCVNEFGIVDGFAYANSIDVHYRKSQQPYFDITNNINDHVTNKEDLELILKKGIDSMLEYGYNLNIALSISGTLLLLGDLDGTLFLHKLMKETFQSMYPRLDVGQRTSFNRFIIAALENEEIYLQSTEINGFNFAQYDPTIVSQYKKEFENLL